MKLKQTGSGSYWISRIKKLSTQLKLILEFVTCKHMLNEDYFLLKSKETTNVATMETENTLAILTLISHFGAKEFALETDNFTSGLIATSSINQPEIGLQNQIWIGLVFVLKLPCFVIRHFERVGGVGPVLSTNAEFKLDILAFFFNFLYHDFSQTFLSHEKFFKNVFVYVQCADYSNQDI